jgi:tRNA pseudouridine38-40 synthase
MSSTAFCRNDIAVLSLTKVADSFDARKSATGKRYSYSFRLGDKRPFEAYEVTQLGHRTLNEDNFQAALSLMKGTHDFRDFTSKAQDKYDFRRTIYDLDVSVDEEGLHRVSFLGNGFMTYQVRIMMGVALKVGMGKMTVEQVKAALDPKERKIISFKAPAEGLCLEEVYYEPIH